MKQSPSISVDLNPNTDGKAPQEYSIVTITKQKTGTADQRIINTNRTIQADLYKVVVTDTEDANFRRELFVTCDAWVDANPGSGIASNVGFELKDAKVNHFTGKVRPKGYPDGNGTEALKLTQRGSEEVHAEPNQTAVDIGSRDKVDTAKGIMIDPTVPKTKGHLDVVTGIPGGGAAINNTHQVNVPNPAVHSTENVNLKQIREAGFRKLKPVPEEHRHQ